MTHGAHEKRSHRMTMGELVSWSGAVATLTPTQLRLPAGTVAHDSRKIGKGDIFLALATDTNDGHQYIESAFRNGASAVIAAKKAKYEVSERYRNRILHVTDPLTAVQRAARRYRDALGILMVGVTGSSGKTTTRSFISQVLDTVFTVGETWGNWNNHIGVPLSILRFTGKEWLGVIEMGANHAGEIHTLSKLTKPDIAVMTNIGYAHVGLFGSLDKTTTAKYEIADGLNRKSGFMLINGDDDRLVAYAKRLGIPTVQFGFSRRCQVVPKDIAVDPEKGISFVVDETPFQLSMPGRHFIYSALPAIFLGRRCGVPDDLIAEALAAIKPVSMRGTREVIGSSAYIVDCYNANPSSMKSALVYLDDVAGSGRKIAVLGEMLELGRYTRRLHRELGRQVAAHGVDCLIAVGPSAESIVSGAVDEGMKKRAVHVCEDADAAATQLAAVVGDNDTVLLKGSRGISLETVFEKMKEGR